MVSDMLWNQLTSLVRVYREPFMSESYEHPSEGTGATFCSKRANFVGEREVSLPGAERRIIPFARV